MYIIYKQIYYLVNVVSIWHFIVDLSLYRLNS
uniref:Uncharacterized protein n=1 Tax=Anguilla anguilla TaxID=7936 RepID=A0A0E9TRF0_ANGAN